MSEDSNPKRSYADDKMYSIRRPGQLPVPISGKDLSDAISKKDINPAGLLVEKLDLPFRHLVIGGAA